jgi:hypothetical protein
MAAARKKRPTSGKSKRREAEPASGPVWDPASVPAGKGDEPTLADEDERAFHATHFSADPRGAAMAGKAPPGASRKHRGGTPPPVPGSTGVEQPAARRKHRGGTPPAQSGPADV